MLEAAVPLLWLSEGGFENRKSEQVSNDVADAWYVVLGSLTGRLRSNDRRVVQLADDISKAAKLVGRHMHGKWCEQLDEWADPELIRTMSKGAARVYKASLAVRAHPEKYFVKGAPYLEYLKSRRSHGP